MILDSGSVKLRCAVGLGLPTRRLARRAALRLHLGPPPGLTLKSLDFQGRFRVLDDRETLLATLQLRGQLIPAVVRTEALVLDRVGLLSVAEQPVDVRLQRRDLRLELRLLADHPLVAHRLVPRRVRAQLRPVERERPQPDEPGLLWPRQDWEFSPSPSD
jgi:hypothetical protein